MPITPVPLILVTGFAGAGKSTLVAHLAASMPGEAHCLAFSNETPRRSTSDGLLQAPINFSVTHTIRSAPSGCLHCLGLVPTQVAITRALRDMQPQLPKMILLEAAADGHGEAAVAALQRPPLSLLVALQEVVAVLRPAWLANPAPSAQAARELAQGASVLIANDWDGTTPELQQRCRDFASELEKCFFTANFGESDYSPQLI